MEFYHYCGFQNAPMDGLSLSFSKEQISLQLKYYSNFKREMEHGDNFLQAIYFYEILLQRIRGDKQPELN
jgi:hypothetical protein